MTPNIQTPFEMKLVYFCRHLLERQEIFLPIEERARRRTVRQCADYPSGFPVQIERIVNVDDFELERFAQEGGFETPFVIKGLFDAPVITWRDLRETCGDSVVPVHPAAQLGESWQYETTQQMTLGDAMQSIERGAAISVVSSSQILVDHPEVLALLMPKALSAAFGINFVRHEMFVAGPGTGSAFHCAVGGNFFYMVCGRKRWILIDPQDSFAMYPTIGRTMRSAIFCSPINSDQYETEQKERYPLYDKIAKYSVTLEPGEILFIPSLWWHEVRNLEPAVGVPSRLWLGGRGRNNLFLLLTIFSTYGLKYLPRAFMGKITGNFEWLMNDAIPQESFGGKRPGSVNISG